VCERERERERERGREREKERESARACVEHTTGRTPKTPPVTIVPGPLPLTSTPLEEEEDALLPASAMLRFAVAPEVVGAVEGRAVAAARVEVEEASCSASSARLRKPCMAITALRSLLKIARSDL